MIGGGEGKRVRLFLDFDPTLSCLLDLNKTKNRSVCENAVTEIRGQSPAPNVNLLLEVRCKFGCVERTCNVGKPMC